MSEEGQSLIRRWWWIWLLPLACGPLVIWGYDSMVTMFWVGVTELEVQFVVTQADTGQPVPGARIEVEQQDGGPSTTFVLVADKNGTASKNCPNCMSYGARSGLGYTNTFHARPPGDWCFRVSAPGFDSTERLWLAALSPPVCRTGQLNAKMTVSVPVNRKRPSK